MFDNIRHDHKIHETWANPALWALVCYRFGVWSLSRRTRVGRWLSGRLYGALRLSTEIVTGIRLHRETKIGKDFHLIHSGMISIHPRVIIGDRVGLMHGVTIGINLGEAVPTIGNDVFIGAHASVLGGVRIGDRARIAANSLVINDVPEGALAIGVPARIIRDAARLGTRSCAPAAGAE